VAWPAYKSLVSNAEMLSTHCSQPAIACCRLRRKPFASTVDCRLTCLSCHKPDKWQAIALPLAESSAGVGNNGLEFEWWVSTSQILWFDAFVLFLAATGHFLVSLSATRQLLIVNENMFKHKLVLSCRDSEQVMPQSLPCCQSSLR